MLNGPVTINYNIGHAENVNLGDNLGTINQGSASPAAVKHHMSTQELNRILNPILDASYMRNRKNSPPDSDCFPGTRVGVIRKISNWADSCVRLNPAHVFFLHGYVGCGKSSISQAVSQKYGRKGRLLASCFLYRNSGDRSKMVRFAVTLASQMMETIPATRPFIEAAVKAQPALLTQAVSLATQLERLVYTPFRAVINRGLILKTLINGPFLIVVDGLDECEDKAKVKEFIEHLLDFFGRHPSTPLRFFITSRIEQHIQGYLKTDGVVVDDLVAHGSDEDILSFLETSFSLQAERDPVIAAYIQSHGQWPTHDDKKTLVRHIGGSFIFASALFKYIVEPLDDGLTPMTRLPLTLNMNPGLDGLYAYTLARSQHLPHFSNVISTVALLVEPLPVTGIADLLGIETFEVLHILVNLQAIIHIPGTDELPVTFCHTSLRDFLITENRSGRFFTPPSHHLDLVYRCYPLRNGGNSTAAASYGIRHSEKHFEQFISLPSSQLDAFYVHILAKLQDLPHFFDIISTLTLCMEPLTTTEIADLLVIEAAEVFEVLVDSRGVMNVPKTDHSPIALHHSLCDFLTNETRSGPFFVSPAYHLKIIYNLTLGRWSSNDGETQSNIHYDDSRWQDHWEQFLNKVPEGSILAELVQLTHLTSQPSPHLHLFTFFVFFLWIFGTSKPQPQYFFRPLGRCIKSLALALECDQVPERWLENRFCKLGFPELKLAHNRVFRFKTHKVDTSGLQRNVQRLEKAIRAKYPKSLLAQINPDSNNFRNSLWLENWTALDAYRLFEWIAARLQLAADSAGTGTTCDLELRISRPSSVITIQPVNSKSGPTMLK